MTANQLRLLGVALLLAAAAAAPQLLGLFGGDSADNGLERSAARNSTRQQQLERTQQERLDHGAYVLRSKQLTETESVETIVIPEALSSEFDTRCVVYRNSELRTSSIACAGILFRQSLPPS